MPREDLLTAELITAARNPVTEHTHIAYAVDANDSIILTKIGVAHVNERGDLNLTLNPAHSTENIILCRKDAG